MNDAIARLLEALPEAGLPYSGSEYPMPVSQAILGEPPDVNQLRHWLEEVADDDVKRQCEPAAIAAELIESAAADRDEYFMDDARVRGLVFTGAKWRAGWVLVAGDGVTDELVGRLKDQEYMVFSSRHEALRDCALPPRETGAVSFLQLMVRYAMTWGQIPPGEDHEMGHFLEQDMPGGMVLLGDVGPVEGLVLLSLMKLGCPAVVGPEFAYDVGPRAVAHSPDQVLAAFAAFPNMRVRRLDGRSLTLPDGADPAHLREKVQPSRSLSGLLQLRPAEVEADIVVTGDPEADHITVEIEVDDPKLDLPVSAHLETEAVRYGAYLPGVMTHRDGDKYRVELAADAFDPQLFGRVIQAGLQRRYPRLGPIRVTVSLGREALDRRRPPIADFAARRQQATEAESEATADEFHLCLDCQPFSHRHACVVTPERPPMCSRHRNEIKASALWGVEHRPWNRRDMEQVELQQVVAVGEPLDAEAGEWAEVNRAVREMTGGKVERVRIHAVREFPHTSCGCFSGLAFDMPDVDGIGVVDRGYEGEVPGGLSWSILANRAGGKQAPGVTGITLKYLSSPKAFAGEGGIGAVRWATQTAFEILEPHLPMDARVATEEQATTMDQLRAFLAEDEVTARAGRALPP